MMRILSLTLAPPSYARYVLPSAVLATIGAHRLAYRLYKAMMLDLEARYA